MEKFFIYVAMGLLGVMLYNLWVFRKHLSSPRLLTTKTFWSAYWLESKFQLLWCLVFIIAISAIVSISPDTAQSIQQLTGLDIANSLPAYFTFGLGISGLVDSKAK